MDSRSRLFATFFIWTAYVLFVVLGLGMLGMTDSYGAAVIILGGGAAFLMTGFFWNWGRLPMAGMVGTYESEAEKDKRRTRVDHVLNSLNEDELEILRHRLSTDDEEQVSIDSLIRHHGEIRRR
jgi:hypothetical protein